MNNQIITNSTPRYWRNLQESILIMQSSKEHIYVSYTCHFNLQNHVASQFGLVRSACANDINVSVETKSFGQSKSSRWVRPLWCWKQHLLSRCSYFHTSIFLITLGTVGSDEHCMKILKAMQLRKCKGRVTSARGSTSTFLSLSLAFLGYLTVNSTSKYQSVSDNHLTKQMHDIIWAETGNMWAF